MNQINMNRMRELINILNKANRAYYIEDKEIMSNYEYDKLYDELLQLEKDSSTILANSPTQKVGYEVLSELPKEKHEHRMLSLDKTKEINKLKDWLANKLGLLSWKLDGLTIVLTYENGLLKKAITRGNGEIGEVVTNNAKVFKNIPLQIPYKERLIIRGEALIKYSDFAKINENLPVEDKYKNPRNLCSGTVRQLNNEITAQRNVHFFAFQVVNANKIDFQDSKEQQLLWLMNQGFECVEYKKVTSKTVEKILEEFSGQITKNDFGSDGLVLTFDSIKYSNELGVTSKFPKDTIAFKWADELKETKLLYLKWNASRTGLINPIAVFEPIELEGTTVSRASVHNVSIVENLKLGEGDTILVYKANMIIPQIADNLTKKGNIEIPKQCPVCNQKTVIKKVNDVKVLYCTNENCLAKQIKAFTHFVSRNAMNIEGLSEATLIKFIEKGFIKSFADIYRIDRHKEQIKETEGLGEKSYNNLIESINESKESLLPNFIYSLGISNVGLSNAKLLCKYFEYDFSKIKKARIEELLNIQGFGEILAQSVNNYFQNEENQKIINDIMQYINLDIPEQTHNELLLEGKTFVITGSMNHYKNRNELKEDIEALGGKVTGTVSKNTDYLINNDIESNSSKNKKAKSLNIPIITEEEFINMKS